MSHPLFANRSLHDYLSILPRRLRLLHLVPRALVTAAAKVLSQLAGGVPVGRLVGWHAFPDHAHGCTGDHGRRMTDAVQRFPVAPLAWCPENTRAKVPATEHTEGDAWTPRFGRRFR